jgi:hypothetical protein
MRNGQNGMVHYKDYVAGWLDSSINEFLAHCPTASTKMDFALLTCLDSNQEPRTLLNESPGLKLLVRQAKPLGAALLIPTARLLEMNAAHQIFFGFDEVWFFPHDQIEPKPESAWLVGPARTDQGKLEKLGPWMANTECSLGLGDGDGLNFLIKARGLVRHLLASTMSQPQPTTGGEVEESARR